MSALHLQIAKFVTALEAPDDTEPVVEIVLTPTAYARVLAEVLPYLTRCNITGEGPLETNVLTIGATRIRPDWPRRVLAIPSDQFTAGADFSDFIASELQRKQANGR